MEFTRGSEWRKWDLHVHTPCSLVQEYGGNTDAAWEKFLSDLEALPPEFGAVGINDYLFIDGYRRVLEEKRRGRLSNLGLILPVVELRLDKFGGSKGHLTRVNFHVIFSDEVHPDLIEAQFLNALSSKYQLAPHDAQQDISWDGVLTRQSLEDFGRSIIESVPEEQRRHYGSPLKEGFNNLNFSLADVQKLLEGKYLKGRVLTAVGKAEWDAIEWNDHSIADKKNVINSAHFAFISAESPEAHAKARAALAKGGVNDRLLDCSDAHRFSDSPEKDRVGKCFTWIKADLTFRGLRQTIHESADRIFVGETPPQLISVRSNPTKFIRSVSVEKVPGSPLAEPWFDGTALPLNAGLVAVIGNKGSGKSALVDVLGLVGDSRHQARASFLTKERFNPPKQPKGAQFEATMAWSGGTPARKRLNGTVDAAAVERVKYIPQNFFESVCNEIAGGGRGAFDNEIEAVIFSHVPPADRLGKASLAELLAYRTEEIERSIGSLRTEVRRLNREIVDLQEKASPRHRDGLSRLRDARRAELEAHDANKPAEVAKPGEGGDEAARAGTARIAAAREKLARLDEEIEARAADQKRLARLLESADKAQQKAANLRTEADALVQSLADELERLGIPLQDVVTFEVRDKPIRARDGALRTEKQTADALLDPEAADSLPKRREAIFKEIESIQAQLDEPGKQYEAYLKALRAWLEARSAIVGAPDIPGSLRYLEAELDRWGDLPVEISHVAGERRTVASAIFAKLVEIKEVYASLYKPVQDFIAGHQIAKDRFRLNFDVSIAQDNFPEGFFKYISQGVNGSFCGVEPGAERLQAIIEQTEFDTEDGVLAFLARIEESLRSDHRKTPREPMEVSSQMRKGVTAAELWDFLFGLEYLSPRYRLQMSGKNLDQLSPGEKGSLLLVFYLLVDRNDVPLLIDQPEENLDNQTIVSLLVPSIKEAKARRQIVIVTHNPNIAVVCDAEQIIVASHEPDEKRITYVCGAIENPMVNQKVMDILEGTRPAFENRSSKYKPA